MLFLLKPNMNSKPSLRTIKSDLAPLQHFWVVVYGSYTTMSYTSRSDLDIAVLTRISDPAKNKKKWSDLLGKFSQEYDIKVFELLPLEVKANIIKNYEVVFGDQLDISEYFYHFRKLWDDSKHRYYENQFSTVAEKMKALGMYGLLQK